MVRKTIVMVAVALVAACAAPGGAGRVSGKNLREIIETQIRDNIRESYGELAGQNFSWDDLKRFKRDNVPGQISDLLRADATFLDAVEQVRRMELPERIAYLKRCRLPLRKTWAELGEISPSGTTDAGRAAELAISTAIVDLTEQLLAPPTNR